MGVAVGIIAGSHIRKQLSPNLYRRLVLLRLVGLGLTLILRVLR